MQLYYSLYSFLKNTQISNFMKIRPVGAELFHADGQADVTKLIVAFAILRTPPLNDKGTVTQKRT